MIFVKLKAWALGVLAFIAALGAAWLLGRRKGVVVEKQAGELRDAQADVQAAQQQVQAQETRHDVEVEVSKLPDAQPQKLADADPATAAGKLAAGWLRD